MSRRPGARMIWRHTFDYSSPVADTNPPETKCQHCGHLHAVEPTVLMDGTERWERACVVDGSPDYGSPCWLPAQDETARP